MLDLLIKDGEVVDGTGAARRRADVGVIAGRVVAVGQIDESARRVVDASGLIVAPGFVDIHTHFDAQAFWDPAMTPASVHGTTTVVAGNCGFSIAPLVPEQGDYLMRMLARVEGMPLATLQAGTPWDWRSTGQFLDRLDGRLAINAGFMVGHSAIRRVVMGDAANERTSTPEELEAMCALLRAGLRVGGMGFSSTWALSHCDAEGNPVPSRFADEHEMVTLASVCREFEGTSLEFIPRTPLTLRHDEADRRVMIAMSRAAQRPLNWNVLFMNNSNDRDLPFRQLETGTEAAQHGARIVALHMPEMPEFRFSFAGTTFDSIHGWGPAMALPLADKVRMLAEPLERRRLADLLERDPEWAVDWGAYVIKETFTPETRRYLNRAVGDIAAEDGKDPFDALLDISVADGVLTRFAKPAPVESREELEARARLCRDPRTILGASDAGAHLDMMCLSGYGANAIARLVRTHHVMTLEEVVHQLTSVPAQFYGLRDRGVLAAGYAADVVIFDEDTIVAGPWETRNDLPAGGARTYSEAIGIERVFVNGTEIVTHNEVTDDRPGTLLRSGRDTGNPPMTF